jgi:hypothetical protein
MKRSSFVTIDPSKLKLVLNNIRDQCSDTVMTELRDEKGRQRIIAALECLQSGPGAASCDLLTMLPDEEALDRAIAAIEESLAKLQTDDFSALKATLAAQAASLDVVFSEFAKRAARTVVLKASEVDMRFALKAQAQCRATVESLARLRNAPAAHPAGDPAAAPSAAKK